MKAHIIKKLMEIEASEGVRILFACESGSRGWGNSVCDNR
ncbi:MAG: nucleotidyltransferase domain-containing protein [Sphingobacterium sp.]|nr:nucleotidyltransferase domain-containing protein [Sphingobacterium sp.]MDR0265093.1 nucleotidyltransferase domain-containing protein [Sphingobacterium sp.]